MSMTTRSIHHLSVGTIGERLGSQYLRGKGFRILETNYQNPLGRRLGEIDIIAEKSGQIVFVEVKTRTVHSQNHPDIFPEENITPRKLHKLDKIAQHYLRTTRQEDIPHHFDALAILYFPDEQRARIRHLEYIHY